MTRSARLITFSVITWLLGCEHVVDAPPPTDRIPVVEALLISGSRPVVRVQWLAAPAARLPPVPAEVRLRLVTDDGDHSPLTPDPDSATLFHVDREIVAATRYRLEGTIGGIAVRATTTIPEPFLIDQPRGDTIAAARAVPTDLVANVPFRWSAPGAVVYLVDSAFFSIGQTTTRAAAGQLRIPLRPPGSPPGPILRILALNRDADGYLNGIPTPLSNVVGGFGVLGGAVAIRRTVLWR